MKSDRKPTVAVLATGGTIAGLGSEGRSTNYLPGQLDIRELLSGVGRIGEIADIRAIQVCNVNSDDITQAHWLELAGIINRMAEDPGVNGFVITHGTDTLEETAYFLNLTVHTDKPVVLTGSMRPSTAISPDGPMNLFQSIALSTSALARNKGVMVVFSDAIYAARDVRKVSTFMTDAFGAGDIGCLGYMIDGAPYFYSRTAKRHTVHTEFEVEGLERLPRVMVAYFTVDADPGILKYCVDQGAEGIVIAGAGAGCYSKRWNEAAEALQGRGIPIVRCSRIGHGMITYDAFYRGDLVMGNDLPPQKASVLLRLALTVTRDPVRIQEMFNVY
ncbi:MAG: asparaginase [Clostridia bacterium]|nr:asparaginase [Clostridia bacterium]